MDLVDGPIGLITSFVCMGENVTQTNTAVRLHLSPAQIAVLAPGVYHLCQSFHVHRRNGTSPFSYPFRIYPPPRGFDRGVFNQQIMEKILELGEDLITKTKTGKSMQMDTLEASAAMRLIVRRDTGESYEEFLTGLAKASGMATPRVRGTRCW